MSNIREVREVTFGGALERELLAGGFFPCALSFCRSALVGIAVLVGDPAVD